MKKSNNQFLLSWWTVVIGVVICHSQMAMAGWTGAINGLGVGFAGANVKSSTLNVSSTNTSANFRSPSAAVSTNTTGYIAKLPLPSGASTASYAWAKTGPGYVMQYSTKPYNGDSADNASIDKLININPAYCASLDLETSANIADDGKSGVMVVNTAATEGTAILLRGFEFDSPTPPEGIDDLETNINSKLKWSILLQGPFNLNSSNCSALYIPFTIETSVSNLYFVADGEAKSLPLEIQCPGNIAVTCGQPIVYPPVGYAGCGNVQVDFNPPENSDFPVGTTPVTVTIKDDYGNSTNCTFTVTVMDLTPPMVPYLPTVTGQCSVQVNPTNAVDICDATSNLVAGTTTDPTYYDKQGTYTVHWKFDDGNGNVVYSNQTVIVQDTQFPTKPVLPDLTYSYCGSTPATPPVPTTMDNCAGTVIGTTTTKFPITTPGTNIVTWTFNDGHGNITTANQKVVLGGLTFSGFYSPIGGTGGTCSAPLITSKLGSITPFKFDFACGGTPITTGTPPVVLIQAYSSKCVAGANLVNANAVYQNGWHYNWDSTGLTKGVYEVMVVLPDGSTQYVFVQLK